MAQQKNLLKIFAITLGFLQFSVSALADCSQQERDLSETAVHTIAGLICSQQVVYLAEKALPFASSGATYFHSWKVDSNSDFIHITGTCAKKIGYASANSPVTLVHPGYALDVKFSNSDLEKCNAKISGVLTELETKYDKPTVGLINKIDEAIKSYRPKAQRTVEIAFNDENPAGRSLKYVTIGYSFADLFQGLSSFTPDKIKKELRSYSMLHTVDQPLILEPRGLDFSKIELNMKLEKVLYAGTSGSLAVSVSGDSYYNSIPSQSKNFYVRMSDIVEGDEVHSNRQMGFNYNGGRNAFFYVGFEPARTTKMAGCTDINESSGTYLKTYDCKSKYETLKWLLEK